MKFLASVFLLCWPLGSVAALLPQLQLQSGHTNTISSLALSPDEKFLLTGSYDRTVKLTDRNRDRWVSCRELAIAVAASVPLLTSNLQHPTVDRDNLDAEFGFPLKP